MKSLCLVLLACASLWAVAPLALAQDEGGDSGEGADSGSTDPGTDSGTESGSAGGTAAGAAGSATGAATAAGGEEGDDEGAVAGDDVGPAARLGGDLGASIRMMVRLLEAKQYEEMLDSFLDPAEKAELLRQTTLSEFAVRFGNGKADELAKILRTLRSKIPQYTSDGAFATFALDSSTNGVRDQIRFHRVEKRWYLKNR